MGRWHRLVHCNRHVRHGDRVMPGRLLGGRHWRRHEGGERSKTHVHAYAHMCMHMLAICMAHMPRACHGCNYIHHKAQVRSHTQEGQDRAWPPKRPMAQSRPHVGMPARSERVPLYLTKKSLRRAQLRPVLNRPRHGYLAHLHLRSHMHWHLPQVMTQPPFSLQ